MYDSTECWQVIAAAHLGMPLLVNWQFSSLEAQPYRFGVATTATFQSRIKHRITLPMVYFGTKLRFENKPFTLSVPYSPNRAGAEEFLSSACY
jgi:hypothetical protein